MTSGTVKSFSRSKRYGFIRLDSDGRDIFVHGSAVRQAGLAVLRKGQQVYFDIYDNRGKAAAKNLRLKPVIKVASQPSAAPMQSAILEAGGSEMRFAMIKKAAPKRTLISRAALERTLAERIRASDQRCEGFLEIFIERVVPGSRGNANWTVKGVKYGKAERDQCNIAIARCTKESQLEFEISD